MIMGNITCNTLMSTLGIEILSILYDHQLLEELLQWRDASLMC